ncbi:hypothetical protein AB1Y20_021728 [Prymnesium parvum]|uniref:Uncharacterized protein n=1 Tax=Prymnesium parvum TaxID=97485 RepID=A0AB34JMB6_PRYPA
MAAQAKKSDHEEEELRSVIMGESDDEELPVHWLKHKEEVAKRLETDLNQFVAQLKRGKLPKAQVNEKLEEIRKEYDQFMQQYSDALRRGTSVNLLLTEVTGARHAHAERFLRLCASAHAARFPHLADSPATLSFYALHSTLLSVACLRGLGEQLRSRIVSSVSRASLRRRAPAGPCAPAPF